MNNELIELTTPGEVLKDEFLDPMGISPYMLAKSIFVDPTRIAGIIHGKRKITVDTSIRLSHFFGNSAEFWWNMQTRYDLEKAKNTDISNLEKIQLFQAS